MVAPVTKTPRLIPRAEQVFESTDARSFFPRYASTNQPSIVEDPKRAIMRWISGHSNTPITHCHY